MVMLKRKSYDGLDALQRRETLNLLDQEIRDPAIEIFPEAPSAD